MCGMCTTNCSISLTLVLLAVNFHIQISTQIANVVDIPQELHLGPRVKKIII